jgi:hypothetical protein
MKNETLHPRGKLKLSVLTLKDFKILWNLLDEMAQILGHLAIF